MVSSLFTLKMAGTVLAFEQGFEVTQVILLKSGSALGVHFFYGRQEQHIAAGGFQAGDILFNGVGIFLVITGIIELSGVYKNGANR